MNKYMKLQTIGAGITVAVLLLLPALTQALVLTHVCPDGTQIPSEIPCQPGVVKGDENVVYGILERVISILFYVLMFLAIIMILIAAFNYATSGGDSEKVDKAKSAILYAVIAVAIAILARSIPYLVKSFVAGNFIGS